MATNYNPGGILCTQYNRVAPSGVIQTLADGDQNVMIIPAEGDVAQSEFGTLVVTEAAQTNGNCFSSAEVNRPNGADMTLTGCSLRRPEYLGFVAQMENSYNAAGLVTGFAAPTKSGSKCQPCSPADAQPQVMATQWSCALDCDGNILLDPADDQPYYEVTVTGPFESIRNDQRFRSSNTVGNNNVSFTITLGENDNMNGGPGGVFAADMLNSAGDPGTWAWWKGLTKVPPPCDPECECADSAGEFITAAGVAAGTQPTPVGG